MHNVIYKLTNKKDGKAYIGLAKNLQKRLNAHKSLSRKENPKQHIHRAIKKYGWDNFNLEIIRFNIDNYRSLYAAEVFYISLHNTFYNGYNMTRGGEGQLGYVYGEKHSKAVSKALNRIEENGLTVMQNASKKVLESRRSYEGECNPFYGKTHTEESRQKMRKPKSNTENMKKSDETKQKISEALKKPKSEEHKQALREAAARRPIRICPHCGTEGKGGNMTRFHFENCKNLNKEDI